MDDDRRCIQCGGLLGNRRLDAVFCRQKCKRRYYRRAQASNYMVPPAGTSGVLTQSRADERFRRQLAGEGVTSQPLTEDERDLLALQRRNPGVLLPQLQQHLIDIGAERRRLELAETYDDWPLKVQDRFTNPDPTVVARRAIQSRRINTPVDPYEYILRPGQPWASSARRPTRMHRRSVVTRTTVAARHPEPLSSIRYIKHTPGVTRRHRNGRGRQWHEIEGVVTMQLLKVFKPLRRAFNGTGQPLHSGVDPLHSIKSFEVLSVSRD